MALSQNCWGPGLRVVPSVKVAEVAEHRIWVKPDPGKLYIHIYPGPALIRASARPWKHRATVGRKGWFAIAQCIQQIHWSLCPHCHGGSGMCFGQSWATSIIFAAGVTQMSSEQRYQWKTVSKPSVDLTSAHGRRSVLVSLVLYPERAAFSLDPWTAWGSLTEMQWMCFQLWTKTAGSWWPNCKRKNCLVPPVS